MRFITQPELEKTIERLPKGEYREYLRMVCEEEPTAGPKPIG
jgi:hypothetical protein